MDLKDLFLTPIYLILIYGMAYWIRPKVTTNVTRKYFIPALTLKLIGAITLGLIYQFYYGSLGNPAGDTFNYFWHSKQITQAFYDSPKIGLKLLFSHGEYDSDTYRYTIWMFWYKAPTEFLIAKIASVIGIFALNTYTVIALFFAFISFSGFWALYIAFLELYPKLTKEFAIAIFFLPSVFFWGSGLMKDSLTLGGLGWVFFGFYNIFIAKKQIFWSIVALIIAGYLILTVKIYILLSFIPPALFWIFNENNRRIKSHTIRLIAKPVFIGLGGIVSYFGALNITAGDEKYDIEKLGERSKITQVYLSEYVTSGSAYNIGELDGTIGGMLKLAPAAVNVTLFRPYLWEVRNPVMLLSALEAVFFMYLTVYLFYQTGILKSLKLIGNTPILLFCFIFSIIFAIGVGTSSGNFGTLVRYKIPLMPFYLSALYIMRSYAQTAKKQKKLIARAISHPA
ncbi:hypothetical protein [Adhaeribacter terreus]|uniref:Glycosyltransferase RgtA/B/C/D-like domain-containing protein n=1 Tax=Adhaeribacter terreus TaxID=529703 RepID=A0ABW0E776_9BACT